jgi:hypothetical protein
MVITMVTTDITLKIFSSVVGAGAGGMLAAHGLCVDIAFTALSRLTPPVDAAECHRIWQGAAHQCVRASVFVLADSAKVCQASGQWIAHLLA